MRVIFAAGGTGGHINPALAAAGELKERYGDAQILFIGARGKMEETLVPKAGFDFKAIPVSGFQRKLSVKNIFRNIATVFRLIYSLVAVRGVIRGFKPDVVVGFGGYVSGPVVKAAASMGIKTAIHEQNAFPGVANKMLAKKADAVMLASAQARQRLSCKVPPVVTGLPVRKEIVDADRDFARAQLGIGDGKKVVFSFGGSLGARAINEVMCELIPRYKDRDNIIFIHSYGSYGKWFIPRLAQAGVECGEDKSVRAYEYIHNMELSLAASDVVVCRAGASTLSELEAVGRASVLIPSPNVAENHQYFNAKELADCGAARLIKESELTAERLASELDELLYDDAERRKTAGNAKKLYVADSRELICDTIASLV